MIADGTYPVARAGVVVTTAAELDALPIDTVVLDCANIPRTKRRADSVMGAGWTHAGRSPLSSEMLADGHPLTVLFRPDAPQPATTDAWAAWDAWATAHPAAARDGYACYRAGARAAAATPTTTGRTHTGRENCPTCFGDCRKTGAEVDREALYADAVNLAAERSPFGHPLPESENRAARAGVDAALAAWGDAAPTVSAEQYAALVREAASHDALAEQCARLGFDPRQSGMATAHRLAARGIRAALGIEVTDRA